MYGWVELKHYQVKKIKQYVETGNEKYQEIPPMRCNVNAVCGFSIDPTTYVP